MLFKEYKAVKYLRQHRLTGTDIAKIRADMKIDIYRSRKLYLSLWPRENGNWWCVGFDDDISADSDVDECVGVAGDWDPEDYETLDEMFESMRKMMQTATWVDIHDIMFEIHALHMVYQMGGVLDD